MFNNSLTPKPLPRQNPVAERFPFKSAPPSSRPQLTANITSAAFAAFVRQHIDPTGTHDTPEAYGMHAVSGPPSPYGTAHVSVIAPNGDAISVTSTINY